MPSIEKTTMADSAKNIFRSKGLSLPEKWTGPGPQYDEAFALEEKQAPANSALNLFGQPTQNQYHADTARTIGENLERFLEGITAAICDAVDKWLKMTFVTGVAINGAVGQLLPGCVVGPALMPLIVSSAPKNTTMETRYSAAIAGAVGEGWQTWQGGLAGTLMYPSFAAFAGPLAPPTTNVPVALMALPSSGESALSPDSLKSRMHALLASPGAQHADALFDAVAKSLNMAFQTFKSATVVQNVLGHGPVPAFAPPFAPAGPVTGGTVIPKPGVLV